MSERNDVSEQSPVLLVTVKERGDAIDNANKMFKWWLFDCGRGRGCVWRNGSVNILTFSLAGAELASRASLYSTVECSTVVR